MNQFEERIRKIMKKKLVETIVSALAVVTLLVGCGNSAKTSSTSVSTENEEKTQNDVNEASVFEGEGLNEATVIRIGGTPTGYLKLVNDQLGIVEKTFDKYGVNVEWYEFSNGPAMIEALATGSLDIAYGIGDSPIISGLANGYEVTSIALGPHSKWGTGIIVREGLVDTVTKLEDLKGLKIALAVGTTNQDFLARELESVGLSEDDVELVNITSADDQLAALLREEVDVAVNIEPNATRIALETNGAKLDYGEPLKVSYGFATANNDFLAENPELAAVFVEALEEVKTYISENIAEYKEFYVQATGYDISILNYLDEWEYTSELDEDVAKSLQSTAEFLYKAGITDTKVDVEGTYTNIYVEEAFRLLREE
jgi:sulfonate transport system substrate-binding protein